jgi:hypothetical protein
MIDRRSPIHRLLSIPRICDSIGTATATLFVPAEGTKKARFINSTNAHTAASRIGYNARYAIKLPH